jgi:cell division topological specificity factor
MTMSNIVDRLFSRKDQRSAKTAMERLRFVLVTDRSQLSPEKLREMQAEIIEVIKKYCRIDETAVEMKLELRERENYLVADIPLAKSVEHPSEEPGRIAFSLQTSNSSTSLEEDDDGA